MDVYKYNEMMWSSYVYECLERQLELYRYYDRVIHPQDHVLKKGIAEMIGTVELKMVLANAIVCNNKEYLIKNKKI